MSSKRQFVSGLPGPDLRPPRQTQTLEQIAADIQRRKQRQLRSAAIKLGKERARAARQRAQEAAERRFCDEQFTAEDIYEEIRRQDSIKAAYAAARARQDHLLPEEEQSLPF